MRRARPFWTASSPDGAFVAVNYWKGSDNCLGGSYTPSTRLTHRTCPTFGTSTYPSYDYLRSRAGSGIPTSGWPGSSATRAGVAERRRPHAGLDHRHRRARAGRLRRSSDRDEAAARRRGGGRHLLQAAQPRAADAFRASSSGAARRATRRRRSSAAPRRTSPTTSAGVTRSGRRTGRRSPGSGPPAGIYVSLAPPSRRAAAPARLVAALVLVGGREVPLTPFDVPLPPPGGGTMTPPAPGGDADADLAGRLPEPERWLRRRRSPPPRSVRVKATGREAGRSRFG